MSDKFAVIGANSFSGSAFVGCMRDLGYPVVEFSRPQFDLNVHGEFIADGIVDEHVSHVINFAALNMVAESWAHFDDYYRTNLIGVARICDRLRELGWNGRFVQVSTPEVYGAQGGLIKEGAPFLPSTPYAVSRAAIDMHLKALHAAFGFRVSFTRSVNVYGPGQPIYRLIPKTVLTILRGEKLKLHGGGVSRRSWLHINDVAEAIRLVALNGRDGEDYHIASEIYVSVRELVELICDQLDVKFDDAVEMTAERPGKDMDYRLDDSKIRAELGWTERGAKSSGPAFTVDWFRNNAAQFEGQSLEYAHRG